MSSNTGNTGSKSSFHIEPYSLMRDIAMNFWVVILAALIGMMGVFIWSRGMYVPQYTSTATLLVNMKNSASYTYTNLATSSEIAQIYTDVLVQPIVRERAAESLGMPSFDGKVSSAVLPDTNIFTVSVTSSSPEVSYSELCAVLEVYPAVADTIFQDSVVEIMRSPNLPTRPSNTIEGRNGVLVVLMLAALALALIVLLSVTRDTVKDETDFRCKVDAKLFGTVLHQREYGSLRELFTRKKMPLLITDARTGFLFTESYQKMATKFEYFKRVEGSSIFLITSVAENEGKSTTASNLALALAGRGSRVLLVDMDYKKPAIQHIFGLTPPEKTDFTAVLTGKTAVEDFRFTQYRDTTLRLALNARPHEDYVRWIHTPAVSTAFRYLAEHSFDYILIDTPPLAVSADVIPLSDIADKTLLVVRTDRDYTADINDAVLSFRENKNGAAFAGCILNDVHREFSLLGQFGADESGKSGAYYGYSGKYSKYSEYSKYSGYSDYHK